MFSDDGGLHDDLIEMLSQALNIVGTVFEMLDRDKNGAVELADLHRMQVRQQPADMTGSCAAS